MKKPNPSRTPNTDLLVAKVNELQLGLEKANRMKKANLYDGFISDTPRTDRLIADVMAKHPGETPRALAVYYEAVHQELAPLARALERENNELTNLRLATNLNSAQHIAALTRERDALRQLLRAADNKLEAIGKYHGGAQATAIDKLREKIRAGLEGQPHES